MKKYLYTALTAALVLSSCASDEMIETAPSRTPIRITTYAQGVTRFNAVTAAPTEFHLYIAVGTGADTEVLFNDLVVLNGTTYELKNGTEPIYWPVDDTQEVTFAATTATGNEVNAFSVDGSEDVLATSVKIKKTESNNGTVTLEFAHILSGVAFSAIAVDELGKGLTASIQSVTLTPSVSNTYNYVEGTWSTTDPSPIDLGYSGNSTLAVGTTTAVALTHNYAATDNVQADLYLPGTYDIEVKYAVVENSKAGTTLTKKGRVTLEAGSLNNVRLRLPVTLTAMTLGVTNTVTAWGTMPNTPTDVTLTD